MLKVNFERALKAPFFTESEEGLLKIYLIALGFSLVVFVLHIVFMVLGLASTILICFIHVIHTAVVLSTQSFEFGYFLESIRLEVSGSRSVMPAWSGNYKKFFWDGVIVQLIFLLYFAFSIVLTVLAFVGCGVIFPVILSHFSAGLNEAGEYLTPVLLILLMLVIIMIPLGISLIVLFMLPMMTVRYAVEQRFLSAFNLWAIWKKIFQNFFSYTLVIVLILLLLLPVLIVAILLCLTIVGWLGIGLLQFVLTIMGLNLFAQIYRNSGAKVEKVI